ncbi:hypothetical protein DL93DRAFT_2073535 [Clavulina sp. PMI_390]|nr:hypothetical protein DL93DRAFT_2073535 [Clavulina sp. PMI_390]
MIHSSIPRGAVRIRDDDDDVEDRPDPQRFIDSTLADPVTPTTATGAGWSEDAPLRTASPDAISPVSPGPPSTAAKWKGKGKAVDRDYTTGSASAHGPAILSAMQGEGVTPGIDSENALARASSASPNEEAQHTLVPSRYPPASEEAIQEEKVNETLARWEQLERQRRKSAREASREQERASQRHSLLRSSIDSHKQSLDATGSSITPQARSRTSTGSGSGTGVVGGGDIARRGSLFWSSAKRKPTGSKPLSMDGDVDGTIPESEELAVVQPDSIDSRKDGFMARQRQHRPARSVDSHKSDSSVATVTPAGVNDAPSSPITPTNASSSTPATKNPFADTQSAVPTRKPSSSAKGKEPMRTPSTSSNPFADSKSSTQSYADTGDEPYGEDEDLMRPTVTHPPTAGALGIARPERYPTPKPLGLPLTAIHDELAREEAERGATGGGGAHEAQAPSAARRQRVDEFEEDDDNGPAEEGRWWTDWLCGCREGPNRGGDNQAGKTNPFE